MSTPHVIPPMTHPYGKVWDQPSLDRMLVDDQVAVMDARSLAELAEYSHSVPSGVYEGKAWCRRVKPTPDGCKDSEGRQW